MMRTVLCALLGLGVVAAVPDYFANRELLKVTGDDFDGKLIFLQALWRHGDRTPTQQFPTDKNVWPQGLGQLTVTGMKDHLILGEKLRQRYVNTVPFVSKRYVSSEIYVHSTDVNRTLTSAISNMIGFYRDAEAEKDFPSDSRWPQGFVPVPVHTEDFHRDFMGNVDRPCPRTKALLNLLRESPQYKKLVEEHAQNTSLSM
uniref:acid phosphatase n=1 Tax=Bursaphelenchus xylophilus TaxID=6326 RepID=A0A1I7SH47_BURXY